MRENMKLIKDIDQLRQEVAKLNSQLRNIDSKTKQDQEEMELL
jgi:hypothetical protein